jgi:hypothetical protein
MLQTQAAPERRPNYSQSTGMSLVFSTTIAT